MNFENVIKLTEALCLGLENECDHVIYQSITNQSKNGKSDLKETLKKMKQKCNVEIKHLRKLIESKNTFVTYNGDKNYSWR